MAVSPSMIDLSRPEPAAPVQAAERVGRGGRTAPDPPAAPAGRRGPGFAEAAVSLTQVGLVGQALVGGAAPLVLPDAVPGGPGRVERVLAPWGVPMLPSEAARLAREAAEAERRAALVAGQGRNGLPTARTGEAPSSLVSGVPADARPSGVADRPLPGSGGSPTAESAPSSSAALNASLVGTAQPAEPSAFAP